jgi:hypothetical protein
LNTALNIVEAITETVFFHEQEAAQVAARVGPGPVKAIDLKLARPPALSPPSDE